MMSNPWKPIEDLPADWRSLTDGELAPLLQFWRDQRSDLERNDRLNGFKQRLAREWSIETGQIEGVYDIDRGVTETLIERGISADLIPKSPGEQNPDLTAQIIIDHYEVLEGLFEFVKGSRSLSKSYIHELHAALLRHQESSVVMDQFGQMFESRLIKGRYKERPNNPKRPDGTFHNYCPPEHVEAEMDRLMAMHQEHVSRGVGPEVVAAWLHHRFTEIHPYQDGNGRVARALASIVAIKGDWFPLVVTRDDRLRYIDALEVADKGDLRSLVSFFVDVEKRALFQATQAAADVQEPKTLDEAISSLRRLLVGPARRLDPGVWIEAKANADKLHAEANARVKSLGSSLTKSMGSGASQVTFGVSEPGMYVSVPALPYAPNTRDYKWNVTLSMSGDGNIRWIQVQAHGIGSKFRGLIGIVVVFNGAGSGSQQASREAFQVNYAEPYDNTLRRFTSWLEESLINALILLRKNL